MNITTYSSSQEVLVGKLNDTNLYRKVFKGTKSNANAEHFSLGSVSASKIIKMDASCITAANSCYNPYYYTSSDFFRCWADSDGLWLMGGSSYPQIPYNWTVIITYTH